MEKGFETEVLSRLAVIESKLDDYNNIKTKSEDAYVMGKENTKDIEEIQEKLKWITRTIVGALITGAIGILIVVLKIGMGLK